MGAFDLILFIPESEALGVYSIRIRWEEELVRGTYGWRKLEV